jgi:hypothetical protein
MIDDEASYQDKKFVHPKTTSIGKTKSWNEIRILLAPAILFIEGNPGQYPCFDESNLPHFSNIFVDYGFPMDQGQNNNQLERAVSYLRLELEYNRNVYKFITVRYFRQ